MTRTESDLPQSSAAELGKLAGIYGLFFAVQAFGYSVGFESNNLQSLDVKNAIFHGIKHLSNFLLPMSHRAWPLSPFTCGILLLYGLYLPNQLRLANTLEIIHIVNRGFFALVTAVTVT